MSELFCRLLGHISPETFFDRYWGQNYLHIKSDSDFGRDFLTVDDVDSLLRSSQISAAFIDVFRDGVPIPVEQWSRLAGPLHRQQRIVQTERLLDLYVSGATLIIVASQGSIARISGACQQLSQELGFPVQGNIYLTPPHAQGFARHSDTHEVIALQIHGRKQWRLFPAAGAPQIIELVAGEMLYIPRGVPHEAASTEVPSLHVTLGMQPIYAFQLVEELAVLAREHSLFQTPAAPARFRTQQLSTDFSTRMEALLETTSAGSLMERRATNSVNAGQTSTEGRLTDLLQPPPLALSTRIRPRRDLPVTTSSAGPSITLESGSKSISIPLFLKPPFDCMLTGKAGTIAEVEGLLGNDEKIQLVRKFIECGFVSIVQT